MSSGGDAGDDGLVLQVAVERDETALAAGAAALGAAEGHGDAAAEVLVDHHVAGVDPVGHAQGAVDVAGVVHGASDATASEPDDKPVSVQDLATTIYHQVGIVADKELMAPGNRPIEIVDDGEVLKDLVG